VPRRRANAPGPAKESDLQCRITVAPTGRQRWKVVPGGLRDAEAALEEVRSRLRRGERVAPTKKTLEETAHDWLEGRSDLRAGTLENYRWAMERHVNPRLGSRKVSDVTEDDIAALIASMRSEGYQGWTVRAVLTPLGGVLAHAERRGLIGTNPMRRLHRGERPRIAPREMRILSRDDVERLVRVAPEKHRTLLTTAVFTGLRLGELLGLTWDNVNFDVGQVNVRRQLSRHGRRVELKTPKAVREVVLMPALGRALADHRLRSEHALGHDFVFASSVGTGLDHAVPRKALAAAVQAAGLSSPDAPALRFHDLRHTFASLLVAQGANVVFVSRQLGHASPDITLKVYAHLFDAVEHAERASQALERGFGSLVSGNAVVTSGGNGAQPEADGSGSNVLALRS
jgi:integrase